MFLSRLLEARKMSDDPTLKCTFILPHSFCGMEKPVYLLDYPSETRIKLSSNLKGRKRELTVYSPSVMF